MRASLEQRLHLTEERVREQEAMVERLKAEVETNLSTITALTGMVEEAQAVQGGREEKNKSLQSMRTRHLAQKPAVIARSRKNQMGQIS